MKQEAANVLGCAKMVEQIKTGSAGVCTSKLTPDVDLGTSKEDATVDINPQRTRFVPPFVIADTSRQLSPLNSGSAL